MFYMPELLSGEWIGVQCILSTVQVEYFSLIFDDRAKVIFYLKGRSYDVTPFPSRSHCHILEETLSDLHIGVYRCVACKESFKNQVQSSKFWPNEM